MPCKGKGRKAPKPRKSPRKPSKSGRRKIVDTVSNSFIIFATFVGDA